ncbi:MAG: hypothetical protein COU33_03170 [Candidatus Magasanikbacteria bacterium CG10_big_fil_rev_8_21_14_0_10_43_6]|uniref:HD domain-containing protein n=1 Tax=Candidatus Magasanikbacteria bacterium CG10_big_fil_rev_8_21_14_0_10_43_6 TaxID=1974650 RepID=A0A2M6W0Y4_9BACT|nr:MAG: hypothetical protein COU33_03170 [Candidatus Magasanikbacteria bacterium CG10_big_fil_rev_8_21_14_0_10_43_6]
MLPEIDTTAFVGRKEKLIAIQRYAKFPRMLYRTNLWTHTHRMSWLVEAVGPAVQHVYPTFNIERARTMAFVHDDIEMIIGDIMFGAKLNMSKEDMDTLHATELAAVKTLAKQFPKIIHGYSYQEVMERYETLAHDDIEAQVVKYIDKFDALGESAHELFAGNDVFLHGYSEVTLPPIESLMTFFTPVSTTYPLLQKLVGRHPLFDPISLPDTAALVKNGTPHTNTTLTQPTSYPPYTLWRDTILTYGGTFAEDMLLKQQEV